MKRDLKINDARIAALILFAGIVLAFAPKEARAERPTTSNPLQYIAQLGPIGFAQGGGAFLPQAVLQSMVQGTVSPIQQYVLVNSMFNQCIKDVKKYTPNERDPFTVAKSKYTYGICRLQKCMQQGMLVLALPLLAQDDGMSGYGQALAAAYQDSEGCGGEGPAIDPALLQLLQ